MAAENAARLEAAAAREARQIAELERRATEAMLAAWRRSPAGRFSATPAEHARLLKPGTPVECVSVSLFGEVDGPPCNGTIDAAPREPVTHETSVLVTLDDGRAAVCGISTVVPILTF